MCVTEEKVRNIIHEENKPLKTKIDSARNWAIGVLLGLLGTLFGMGVWVGTVDSQVATVIESQRNFETSIDHKLERIENLILQLTKDVSSNNN